MNTDVSIVIVSWNAKDYLMKCLSSIKQNAEGIKYEIIVVDNASSDGSQEAIRELHADVKLICNEDNFGFAKANNIGITIASGRYLALVNSDVEFTENSLIKMLNYMDEHLDVGILGPRILNRDLTLQYSCEKEPSIYLSIIRAFAIDNLFPSIARPNHHCTNSVPVIIGCFWLVRSKAIENVGMLDEGFFIYAEDFDWCKRFREAKWDIVYYPQTSAIHYGGASSGNEKMRFNLEMRRAMMRYYRKHKGIIGQSTIFIITLIHEVIRIAGQLARLLFSKTDRQMRLYKIHRSWASIVWLLKFQWLNFK